MRLLPAFAVLLALIACSPDDKGPAGPPESKTYDFKDFTRIKIETGGIGIRLQQGPFHIVATSLYGNADLSRLKINLRGDELQISRSDRFTLGERPVYVMTVTAPTYTAIDITGIAGAVNLQADDLLLENISINASAGANARLTGVCKFLALSTNFDATINTSALKCEKVVASAAARGEAEIFVRSQVTASAKFGAKTDDPWPPGPS